MKDEPREPINVFAVDQKMNRVTGSVPYTSLRWVRRYTKPGEFEMVVPANIFDPSWAFIVCDDRPETGIVQKVQFDDSSEVYGGIDSVTVSGFFLESILNNIVFLQESPEQKKVYVPKPRRPVGRPSSAPDVYQDPTGGYWVELSTGQLQDVVTGALIDGATDGMTSVKYNDAYADNNWGTDSAYMYYDYWSTDDHSTVSRVKNGETQTFDVLFEDDRGNAFFRDDSGRLTQATAIKESKGSTYTMKKKAWNALPDDDPYGRYHIVNVQGPWQRTEMMEPVTVGDSIQIVMKWARRMMGDWIVYEEPTIDGIQKSVDPSFQYLGDLLYKTLYEVGASLRLEYLFESNAYILSVYRGQDRTQSGTETQTAPALTMARSAAPMANFPSGFTKLEYVQNNGTQYIDTGFTPDGDTRVVCTFQSSYISPNTSSGNYPVYGSGADYDDRAFEFWTVSYGFAAYGSQDYLDGFGLSPNTVYTIDHNKNVVSVGGVQKSLLKQTFESPYSMLIFATHRQGGITVSAEAQSLRVYSMKVYDNGVLARDFVPAKRDSDGAVGMWDPVGQQFYENAGTGSFNAGPESPTITLSYNANNAGATGSTAAQSGYEGDAIQVSECGFSVPNMSFTGWNTAADESGAAYAPGDYYTLGSSDATLYAQWSPIADSLTYDANASDATGQTPATAGTVGSQVTVAECGFARDNWVFVGWNTNASGTGHAYQPGESYTLTSGYDMLYAQWEYVVPGGKAPWAVFSDTWGTLTGYSASQDTSNYKNTCHVLYDYDKPDSFDANGWPHAGVIYAIDDTFRGSLYGIAYTSMRGYNTEHVGDDTEPAIETYLDLRDEKPSCDGDWSREITQLDTSSDQAYYESLKSAAEKYAPPTDGSTDLQSIYRAYEAALPGRGEQHLKENYYVETQLDTGTVKTNGYLRDFDMGDLVDMAVSTVGLSKQARIIEVEESYTSGDVDICLTIGDEKLTNIQKARLS